jgi:hypothetical protein
MKSSVSYFYEGVSRWSFGFENPNMAAVVFVCLLPLLFALWSLSWDSRITRWLKIIGIICSGILVLMDGLCLFKTYSRGGVVAAVVALACFFLWVGWKYRSETWMEIFRLAKFNATCGLIGLFVALFLWVGLGDRSLEPITGGDASVSHRLVLWQSALQMAVENPLGFGTGKSGEAYMQWYQPVDSTNGYRTMVNSYLTFLVEQGWLWFALVLLVTSLFWFWAQPGKSSRSSLVIATGLRASILAFLISGIFSTVMEEPILWIIPACCALILAGWSLRSRISFTWPKAGLATTLTFLILTALYLGGLRQSLNDPLSRKFAQGADGWTASELALKKSSPGRKTWVVVPDAKIFGPYYGKLLRQLVAESGVVLELKKSSDLHSSMDRMLLAGNAVQTSVIPSTCTTVLLAPSAISDASAQAWLTSSPHLILLIPSIDEDRRTSFWRQCVPDRAPPHVTVTTLDGVGLRVDWAWEQVINLIRNS